MTNTIPFHINTLYLITSPRLGEEGLSRRLTESVADVLNHVGSCNFYSATIHNGDGFFLVLDKIFWEIKSGLKPMIHFDMHGSQQKGLEIGSTGEFIDWQSVMDCLRFLNEELKNELVVVITACHGLHLIQSISLEKVSPFLCLIAPENEIIVATIEDNDPLREYRTP